MASSFADALKRFAGRLPFAAKQGGKADASAADAQLRRLTARQVALIAAVLVLTTIPPVFVNHPIGYIPVMFFVILLALSWVYLCLAGKRIAVDVDLRDGSATRGTSCALPVILKNRSKFPVVDARVHLYVANPYGVIEQDAPVTVLVDGMADARIDAGVSLEHMGVYTAGVKNVVLYDPFKFLHKTVDCSYENRVVSIPYEAEIDSVELSCLIMQESFTPQRAVISDDVDYAGVRDYEFGDPMKSVHWKLSARTENLQTRLFETTVSSSTSIIMDFHGPDYTVQQLMACMDGVVELALASARLAAARNMELKVCYEGREGAVALKELPSTAELEELTRTLPCLSPDISARYAADLVAVETSGRATSDNIVLCTSKLEREMVAQLVAACSRRVNVTVFLVVPHDFKRDFYKDNRGLMGELKGAGMTCIVVSGCEELEVSVDGG